MRIHIEFKPAMILAFSLAAIMLSGISALFLTLIDPIVNKELYNHGLQFNAEWAERYGLYLRLFASFTAFSMLLTAFAIVLTMLYARRRVDTLRSVSCFLLAAGTFLTVLSIFSFLSLDSVVHSDLYRYGLQFSSVWAAKYWTYARLMLGLQTVSIAATVASTALTGLSIPDQINIHPPKLIRTTMLIVGAIALVSSAFYNSSILAFIGLGLVFWGAILSYVQDEEYVKKTILDVAATPAFSALNEMIRKLDYKGEAVYLPPIYLKDPESSRVLILKQKSGKLPTPEQIQDQEGKAFTADSQSLLVTAPGGELAKLFEKTLNTSFTKADLQYVQQNLPKLLIEDLEAAENVKIEDTGKAVHVTMEKTVFRNLDNEDSKLADDSHLGSLLSSAIACVLAKATGKPTTIIKEQMSKDGKAISIEYGLLEETEEERPQ